MNYYVGDTDPPLVFDLRVDGQVPDDLAGATARIYARYENTPVLLLNSASAVLDAAAGTATYQWGVSDLAVAGDIVAWCVVTKSGGRKQTTPTVRFAIVDHDAADLAGYYTTPNRVRDEFDVDDETLDDTRAARLIRDASDLVDQLLGSYLPDATTGRKILQADVERTGKSMEEMKKRVEAGKPAAKGGADREAVRQAILASGLFAGTGEPVTAAVVR